MGFGSEQSLVWGTGGGGEVGGELEGGLGEGDETTAPQWVPPRLGGCIEPHGLPRWWWDCRRGRHWDGGRGRSPPEPRA